MAVAEKMTIDEILNDIGIHGPAREPTKKYAEKLQKENAYLTDHEINFMIGAYYDGYEDALKAR